MKIIITDKVDGNRYDIGEVVEIRKGYCNGNINGGYDLLKNDDRSVKTILKILRETYGYDYEFLDEDTREKSDEWKKAPLDTIEKMLQLIGLKNDDIIEIKESSYNPYTIKEDKAINRISSSIRWIERLVIEKNEYRILETHDIVFDEKEQKINKSQYNRIKDILKESE